MTELQTKSQDLIDLLPKVSGRYSLDAPIGKTSWFQCGGTADVLFKPKDEDDLAQFMSGCSSDIPVTVLGVASNVIIRDGGVRGVVIRLGREFNHIEVLDNNRLVAGAVCLDINVAQKSQEAGITGLEFFAGIPGTIGGALRMNAGAYGGETKDVLIKAHAISRSGKKLELSVADLNMTYRHTDTPDGAIFTKAEFQGEAGDPSDIQARIEEIKQKREDSQPIREKTGGSTFANPSAKELEKAGLPTDMKVWQLIDKVQGRGYKVGGAQMSEKHCNFMINTGAATAQNLEDLGEEMRRRVNQEFGIALRWEIRRIGEKAA